MLRLLAYSGPMGEGEMVTAAICAVAAAGIWARGVRQAVRPAAMVAPVWARVVLILAPVACLALMAALINEFGDREVQGDWRYVGMYTAIGALWLAIGVGAGFNALGLHGRVDALERRNRAALIAQTGALLGLTLCYIGGNLGDGPSWLVVIFSSGLATLALAVAWGAVEGLTKISALISIHRDTAAGLRLAGLLIGCGTIFGRGAAGTWVSAPATVFDMLLAAWPALAPVSMEILLSRAWKPTASRPTSPTLVAGLGPAVVYIAFGAGVVYAMGWWA